jgi:hypothetical protein
VGDPRQTVQEVGVGGTVTVTIVRGEQRLELEVEVAAADE